VLRFLRRGARLFGLWGLPPLVLALLLVLGFAAWCVTSAPGTRWLLQTVAGQLDGEARGVQGSIVHGLSVEDLSLSLPDVDVRVVGLHLKALWPELLQRRLHIDDLSAERLDVDARSPPQAAGPPPEPFRVPALPIGVKVDHFALGGLNLTINGAEPPVRLLSVSTALTLDARAATVVLDELRAVHEATLLELDGRLALQALAAPWPFTLDVRAKAQAQGADSPVCLRPLLQGGQAPAEAACQVDLDLHLDGSLDAVQLRASGRGEGMTLAAEATLYPDRAFPLGPARLDLGLPGDAGVALTVTPQAPAADGLRPLEAQFAVRQLRLDPWLPPGVGATRLNLQGTLQAHLTPGHQLQDAALRVSFDGPNQWNGQALSGHVRLGRLARTQGPLYDAQAPAAPDWLALVASGLDIDLSLGADRIRATGDLAAAASQLRLEARMPALAALWPGLPGGADVDLDSRGSLADHRATLKARYTPADARAGVPGQAPLDLDLGVAGGWTAAGGWRGRVSGLQVEHADLGVRSQAPITLGLDPAGAWQVGPATLDVSLAGDSLLKLQHQASQGAEGRWATRGRIDPLVITPERIEQLQQWLGRAQAQAGGVRTALSDEARHSRLVTRLEWNLDFTDALAGEIRLRRLDGDLTVPGDVPVRLGLQAASLDLVIRRLGAGLSRAEADLQVNTAEMGRMRLRADAPVHAAPGAGLAVRTVDEKHLRLEAVSENLAWINLFLDGALEIGGTVHADIQGRSRPDGRWVFTGPLRGEKLRLIEADQGVRLMDGTLQAHADGSRLVLDHLRFPAQARVKPKEWRTATWVAENPEAQGGYLDVSGQWDLYAQEGGTQVSFYRYPILQRADRYAMISGNIQVRATLPQIRVQGKIVADAGWFDLDMLNNIPALDGDVVVLKPGQKVVEPPAPPPDLTADVTIDLGPRFYLTGYGVDAGLVGSLDLSLREGRLKALGALRTRGGAIDAYGQHLQLRRGTVTFQGDVTNPVLDIEALRTDVSVQAGVRVAGTARRPRIDLVSRPEVSETEKLTWLLLGHGPDAGGDMTLLFSVGGSFLSGGEPFYKRFGLDELSMRSGALGSTGSVLPVDTVVSGMDTGASPIEQRFVLAGKTLTSDLKVSLEQALAQTGTVARRSYRLMRRLQAEVTVGTVNGLALVYRWVSKE
jgi:translocation and assembly module TamB